MKKHSGLTLIEVLIASMILFMALGLVAAVFQQNMQTQLQAEKYLQATQDYVTIQSQIRFQLKQGEHQGEIMTPAGSYSWTAELVEQRMEMAALDTEGGSRMTGQGSLRLYQVKVESSNKVNFEFKQAVWSDRLV